MKKYILIYIIVLVISGLSASCTQNRLGQADESKDPIVTVLENTLYRSDLEGVVPYGMSPEDSIIATKAFIQMWVEDQLIYDNAVKNITQNDEINQLVAEYKRSLIINSYISNLLNEKLSQSISDEDLMEFYLENKKQLDLKENIIKGFFLKIPKESSQLENYLKWYKQDNDEALSNIDKYSLQYTTAYENFSSYWVDFDDIIDNMPASIPNPKSFLEKNNTLEAKDSSFVYLLNIKEYKLAGSEPPFEYIKDKLTDIYRESSRDEFIKKLNAYLQEKALSSGNIKYYIE